MPVNIKKPKLIDQELTMTNKTMRPEKTVLVCKHNGREVGRIPATARTAEIYLEEMALHYKDLTVEYVYDENAELLALFKNP